MSGMMVLGLSLNLTLLLLKLLVIYLDFIKSIELLCCRSDVLIIWFL